MINLKTFKCVVFISICLNSYLFWGQDYKLSLENRPIYYANKTTESIKVDGIMDEKSWKNVEGRTLDYFHKLKQPNDKQKTTFRMLWDEKSLYLFYECEDKYLTASEKNRDGMPYLDDCAEIFVIPVPNSAGMHFCFEINIYEAKNDVVYINDFYEGNDTVVKTFNPEYQVKVTTNGTINNNSDIDIGWTMELAIPLEAFRGSTELYPVKTGTQWAFMALRQERNDPEPGRRVTSTIFPIPDISSNVHQPNEFGLVEFVD